jgi:hypothetical protein
MCCLTTIFLVFSSRITILVWWLMDPERFSLASKTLGLSGLFAIPVWIWTVLGGIFLPWTTNGSRWESPYWSTWPGMAATTTATTSQAIAEANKDYQWQ